MKKREAWGIGWACPGPQSRVGTEQVREARSPPLSQASRWGRPVSARAELCA